MKSKNNFSFRCNYFNLTFETEIKKLAMFQNLYLVYFSKLDGNYDNYNEICSQLLILLKL